MIDEWYLTNLVCCVDHTPLEYRNGHLVSDKGRKYPVVDGVPIMLSEEENFTHGHMLLALKRARGEIAPDVRAPHLYIEAMTQPESMREAIAQMANKGDNAVDPYVSHMVAS